MTEGPLKKAADIFGSIFPAQPCMLQKEQHHFSVFLAHFLLSDATRFLVLSIILVLPTLQTNQTNHGVHGFETSAESIAHVRNSLVMRNRLTSAAIKSSFLHNVLKHKDKMSIDIQLLSLIDLESFTH